MARDSKGRLLKGNIPWNKGVPMRQKYPFAGFQNGNKLGKLSVTLSFERILKDAKELEKQGFRVVPIGKIVPDIIAFKDNKIFAVEVEYGRKPNYNKYNINNYKNYFDDVIWILRKKEKL